MDRGRESDPANAVCQAGIRDDTHSGHLRTVSQAEADPFQESTRGNAGEVIDGHPEIEVDVVKSDLCES